jgi:hypothetical protein
MILFHQNGNTLVQKLLMNLLKKIIIDNNMSFQFLEIECLLYQNDVRLLSKKLPKRKMVQLSKKL